MYVKRSDSPDSHNTGMPKRRPPAMAMMNAATAAMRTSVRAKTARRSGMTRSEARARSSPMATSTATGAKSGST